ncbi:MAG: mechanosensitive ion channel family protein [Nocardioides sp.]
MSTNPCSPKDVACNLTWDATGSAPAATAAEYFIGRPATVIGIIVGAFVVRWFARKVIDRIVRHAEDGLLGSRLSSGRIGSLRIRDTRLGAVLNLEEGDYGERRVARTRAIGSLLKSIASGLIFAVALLMVLSELNLDITPLLASAGILGLALGFGGQSLVKDFLSGLFVIIEDQFGVGDTVNLGEATGVVEAVSLRVTRLRDHSGTVWYVRNGEILRVANQSQNWARAIVDVLVAPTADLTKAQAILRSVAQDIWEDDELNDVLVELPEVAGVETVNGEAATLRVHVKTTPTAQVRIARVFRERATSRLAAEGIEFPRLRAR